MSAPAPHDRYNMESQHREIYPSDLSDKHKKDVPVKAERPTVSKLIGMTPEWSERSVSLFSPIGNHAWLIRDLSF